MGLRKFFTPQFARWLAVTLVFTVVSLVLIKALVSYLGWPYSAATLCSAEVCTLCRYLALDRSVFHTGGLSWSRLWRYHVASAAGFVVWWISANLLKTYGVNYLIAAVLATFSSVGLNLASNFFWVWRKPTSGEVK